MTTHRDQAVTAVREVIGDGSFPRSIVAALADRFPEADVRTAIWDLIEQGAAEITGERKVKLRATPAAGKAPVKEPAQAARG